MRTEAVLLAALMTLSAAQAQDERPKAAASIQPAVEIEEDVYSYAPADNGAGPMWCHGSTCLVRVGDDVFASGLETLANAKPLNNCRWMLHKRGPARWELQQADETGHTREPCPLAALPGGKLLLSVNPTLAPDQRAGPARPEILLFSAMNTKGVSETVLPVWDGKPQFTEHSYRSLAADGLTGSVILFQNIGYTHAEWAFRDETGNWPARGKLTWPHGAEYDKPGPIRVCYPNVALKGRAVHFCGVSDIVEPYAKWRDAKRRITGQEWDYDFRRLFYTWSSDITTGRFQTWVEIASRDKTCGWINPGDLWLAPDGTVHIVWTERAIDERLRKEFFAGEKQSHALNYAVVRDGKVTSRRTLLLAEEGGANEIPSRGRLQPTPDGRLFVFYYVSGTTADGKRVSENRLVELLPDGSSGPQVRVPLKQPFTEYFTATVRAGSPPSKILDVLGPRAGSGQAIGYARIRLMP